MCIQTLIAERWDMCPSICPATMFGLSCKTFDCTMRCLGLLRRLLKFATAAQYTTSAHTLEKYMEIWAVGWCTYAAVSTGHWTHALAEATHSLVSVLHGATGGLGCC